MNKTIEALKLAEEALDELRYANDTLIAKTKYYKTLAAIREALAEQDHIADAGKVIAEPVKQEPVAFVSDVHLSRYTLEWNGQPLPEGTKLYAAPVQPVKQDPVAYLVTGPYVKHACADIGLTEAYCSGLNKGFGDAAYSVSPLYAAPVSVEAIRAEALEEAAKVCRTAQAQGLQSIREAIEEAIRGLK